MPLLPFGSTADQALLPRLACSNSSVRVALITLAKSVKTRTLGPHEATFLFIDQPTQVGFSYSIPVPGVMDPDSGEITVLKDGKCPPDSNGTCGTWSLPFVNLTANSTVNAAPNVWKTLQGFLGAFPEYSRDGIHLTTDSYGGHYGPVFSEYFFHQNTKNIPGAVNISLHSLVIGNGWIDPIIVTL